MAIHYDITFFYYYCEVNKVQGWWSCATCVQREKNEKSIMMNDEAVLVVWCGIIK